MSDKRKEDLYSIGAIYGDMLNGVKTAIIKEEKKVPVGVIGDAPLEAGGGTERGGFEPSAVDIYRMTDKEKDENLYNIKGLTYGDKNDPGMENQQSQPTGPEFGQVSYTGNVGGPEEDEEHKGTHDKTGGLSDKALLKKVRRRKGAAGKALLNKAQKEINKTGRVRKHTRDSLARDAYEGEEEIFAEHEKNARRSLNNFMAKQSVFDKLYNKVMISEQGPYAAGLEGEEVQETDFEELEALGIESEEPEDITVTLPSDLAQTLCDILQAALEDQQVEVETEVDVSETETVDFEEDEEATMKDGGGYGMDAGSTLKKEINYGKKNRVGRLRPATGLVQKDGGGYGMDAGSTLSKEINYGKQNKVGTLRTGPIPGA